LNGAAFPSKQKKDSTNYRGEPESEERGMRGKKRGGRKSGEKKKISEKR